MPERTDHNEAMRLADELAEEAERRVCHVAMAPASLLKDAAALLRQLSAERDQLRAEVEALRDSNAAKADRIDRLGEIVEALRADAGRLDWIEHQYLEDLVMGLAVDCEHDGQYYVCGDDNKTGYGDSLRAAIDHARTTHKDEG